MHGEVSSLFHDSDFCGETGAVLPVRRRRICVGGGQKAVRVADDLMQL